jgi:hypothetical protein
MRARFSVTSNSPAPVAGFAARVRDYALLFGSAGQLLKAYLRRRTNSVHARSN